MSDGPNKQKEKERQIIGLMIIIKCLEMERNAHFTNGRVAHKHTLDVATRMRRLHHEWV